MSEVAYLRWGESSPSKKEVSSDAFGDRVRRRLLFDAVIMYEANKRVGTASTRGRGEVSGTSRKPFGQKGTGRARVGTLQSPSRRGGGVASGPKPRDFGHAMPKKMRRGALQSALLSKFRDGEVAIVDKFGMGGPKTKELSAFLDKLGLAGSKLIVTKEQDNNVYLSARNLPRVEVRIQADLNAWDVLRYKYLVITEDALAALEERMKNA